MGAAVNILNCFSKSLGNMAIKPVSINTFTSLKWQTLKILNIDWDVMLVVAETGEWLIQPEVLNIINKVKERKLFLLIADPSYKTHLENVLEIESEIKILPWWVHNKHMTICCKKLKDGSQNQKSGIYFIRRMRSPIIDAVRLEDKDCEVILNIFHSYWAKVKQCRLQYFLKRVVLDDVPVKERYWWHTNPKIKIFQLFSF